MLQIVWASIVAAAIVAAMPKRVRRLVAVVLVGSVMFAAFLAAGFAGANALADEYQYGHIVRVDITNGIITVLCEDGNEYQYAAQGDIEVVGRIRLTISDGAVVAVDDGPIRPARSRLNLLTK